jgi:large subunit ribosomal protein L15
MAEKKKAKKSPARRATGMKKAAASKPRAAKARAPKATAAKAPAAKAPAAVKSPAAKKHEAALGGTRGVLKLGALRPAAGSWPKRQRIGRGHGSGMVKTGGEGGKGQTVRSGGGKGRTFEGGQTPWARRLPHRRGYSQKARDIGHFRSRFAVVNLHRLAAWDPKIEVSPESLRERGLLKSTLDGVKILGGTQSGKSIPQGLRFRDVAFSQSAREALAASGAQLGLAEPSET